MVRLGPRDLGCLTGASDANQNYFRDYDPAIGRYVESDPIGLWGVSASTFAYALNSPLRLIDPRGLNPFQPSPLTELEIAILEGNVEALSSIADAAGLSSADTAAALARAAANARKIAHIFDQAKHKLDAIIQACGSEGKALRTLQELGAKHFPTTVNGLAQEFSVTINGISVTIRGILVNGEFQLGTAFIP